MMPDSFRVEVADNGFVVRYDDPEIMKRNRERDTGWDDPERTAVFTTVDELKDGLDTVVDAVVKASKEQSEERAKDFMGAFKETVDEG